MLAPSTKPPLRRPIFFNRNLRQIYFVHLPRILLIPKLTILTACSVPPEPIARLRRARSGAPHHAYWDMVISLPSSFCGGAAGGGTSGVPRRSIASCSCDLWNLTLTILLTPCSSIVTP